MKYLVTAFLLVCTWQALQLLNLGAYASAIAGAEPSFAKSLAGLAFVLVRMLSIVLAPPLVVTAVVDLVVRQRRKGPENHDMNPSGATLDHRKPPGYL
jgi:hypothetical protein